ncbi:sugar transferase [Staphylococcus carnosus]|uniref:Capsular polysaccharide synthesis enzyme Cap5M n=1 Tax=Staphylococcus carnosus (strain TM300) TaxID=396513 RepID=B9DIN4_STACT|nr:sugar transferase [Staphylococcus carnosus]QPT03005.1 sugar transferase [Staphylococcus carnosus]UQA68009.1 sugar transferase [Staphylococcus carnosus]UTB77175.1 capsular biosynthesis protein [Staphylococcus carnosus]UTB86720.1 capsular biosynthesis protein [Staphylococcus carnosus]UTB89069.1 capsular biosynthesis protein [Staphylococcus carnosus]
MKRIFDFLSSLFVIIIAAPVFVITALAIKAESKGPIIFKQKRPGINNTIFNIYKFRSMKIDTPNVATDLIDPSTYITKSGKFIRRTSIDELPQLFNILKGDMSVVGPRPALYNQYELIEKRTKKDVHLVRPGLTGLAQVMGRDNISDDQKVQYDKYYVDNQTFLLDMFIIYKTIKNTITSEGVSH